MFSPVTRTRGSALLCLMLVTLMLVTLIVSTVASDRKVNSPFPDANPLVPPAEREGFTFAILGDRTGGPESGLAILEQAVIELNRLSPDLVMNVGDMINGYNREPEWIGQMQRFKRIMSRLKMPWYPTPGNHDVYSPGGNTKNRANEKLYQRFFGPLYYSFDYKDTHFIVLYSDEKLSFRNPPVDQQMSKEQLDWLSRDLAGVQARHVFVFLHHPRWNYPGDVWEPVHKVLAGSGKVTAVIGGHWHRYRSDGDRDGIRYYCLATTGGVSDNLPAAGALHHYNLVSVREDGWNMTVIPVGAVLDPDFVTGRESEDIFGMKNGRFLAIGSGKIPAPLEASTKVVTVAGIENTTTKPLSFSLRWRGLPGEGWRVEPAEASVELKPGDRADVRFSFEAGRLGDDEPLPEVHLEAETVYPLEKGGRQEIRVQRILDYAMPPMPAALTADDPTPRADRALVLDGRNDCVLVPSRDELNPEGPFTLECWAKVERPGDRAALMAKTESSAYGLFLADGGDRAPGFSLYFEGKGYASARGSEDDLPYGTWAHYACVFDGEALRLFVNGRLVGETLQNGPLRGNELPLIIGADVNRDGKPLSFTPGLVDEVRLSAVARYRGVFQPARRFGADEKTLMLLHFDRLFGNLTPDTSGNGHHGRLVGGTRIVEIEGEK